MGLSPTQIRRARETQGLTQYELAARLDMSQPAVAHWEAGRTSPRDGAAQRLREVLQIGQLTDEEAVEKAAQAILQADRAHGEYHGITADEVISQHVDGSWRDNIGRWADLLRAALRRAREEDPAVGKTVYGGRNRRSA